MNQSDAEPFQMTGRQHLVYRSLIEDSQLVDLLPEYILRAPEDALRLGKHKRCWDDLASSEDGVL